MALGMRTIYVAVRGLNYTDRATREVGANVTKMQKQQQQLKLQMTQTFAAGIMWTAMAGMMTMGILKIMESSISGRIALHGLTNSVNQLTTALSDQFAKILGPLITMVSDFLEVISKNEPLMRMITSLVIISTVLIAVKGATMLAGVAIQFLNGWLTSTSATLTLWTTSAQFASFSTMGLAGAFSVLQASLGPAVVIFMTMYQLATAFGEHAPILLGVIGALTAAMVIYAAASWSAATALSILTFGAAALIGVGAAIYAQSQMPTYAIGTKYVQKTGPAIVHQGEEIRSAYEVNQKRLQSLNQRPYPTRTNQVTISIGTIKTKADEEELKPLILKVVKDAMDDKV